ncbi:MAG: LysR family transcriptional regulator [Burkholderiales bacterium]|nr:LysR family transcriptional regulator [Burkholderiales bacterium]
MISASPRRLSVFKAVADLGGFNPAADKLGIAQPSVGAHIRALERQLGQTLVHRRRGTRSRLTKAGETLYAYAADALSKSEAASRALTNLRAGASRGIVLAAQRAIAHHFLPECLAAFAAGHPGVRLVTRTGTGEDVLALLREGAVDLGLFPALGPVAGIESEVLMREPLALLVAPSHPLASRTSVGPDDLRGCAFICGLRESQFRQMTDQILRRFGLSQYEVAMELQDFAAVKELARRGAGIACELRRWVADEVHAGTLVPLPLAGPEPTVQIRCAYQAPLSQPAGEFLALLREHARGAAASPA